MKIVRGFAYELLQREIDHWDNESPELHDAFYVGKQEYPIAMDCFTFGYRYLDADPEWYSADLETTCRVLQKQGVLTRKNGRYQIRPELLQEPVTDIKPVVEYICDHFVAARTRSEDNFRIVHCDTRII